jgi:hypothetical protein
MVVDNIQRVEDILKQRQEIYKQLKTPDTNDDDIKILKNKYHSLSNRISYLKNRDKIREQKRKTNKLYNEKLTDDVKEKRREYNRKYQRTLREVYKYHQSNETKND